MADNRPYDSPNDRSDYDRAQGSDRDERNFRSGGTGYGGGSRYTQQSQGDRDRDDGRGYRQSSYGQQRFGGGSDDHRPHNDSDNRDRGYGRQPEGYRYQDRGFLDRAGDEVRSWFGDDDAERRREYDQRQDERQNASTGSSGGGYHPRDADYHGWRREQIAQLDRDYDEYRRESQTKFDNEFGSWRTERQTQRGSLGKATEHMEVVGSDGGHIGTVDKIQGDRILLTKNDPDAGGRHHSIPSRWIDRVEDKVTIRKTAEEAKAHWRDEERTGAMFGDKADDSDGKGRTVNLDRSFGGTY